MNCSAKMPIFLTEQPLPPNVHQPATAPLTPPTPQLLTVPTRQRTTTPDILQTPERLLLLELLHGVSLFIS